MTKENKEQNGAKAPKQKEDVTHGTYGGKKRKRAELFIMVTFTSTPAAIAVTAPSFNNFLDLPDDLLARTLDYLAFEDMRSFHLCTKELWKSKRLLYEVRISILVLTKCPPLEFLSTVVNVETLDFGPHCSNAILEHMTDERVLPKLKHLSMARSNVTDEDLLSLLENHNRRRLLKSLDITFCRRTTFDVVSRKRRTQSAPRHSTPARVDGWILCLSWVASIVESNDPITITESPFVIDLHTN